MLQWRYRGSPTVQTSAFCRPARLLHPIQPFWFLDPEPKPTPRPRAHPAQSRRCRRAPPPNPSTMGGGASKSAVHDRALKLGSTPLLVHLDAPSVQILAALCEEQTIPAGELVT